MVRVDHVILIASKDDRGTTLAAIVCDRAVRSSNVDHDKAHLFYGEHFVGSVWLNAINPDEDLDALLDETAGEVW